VPPDRSSTSSRVTPPRVQSIVIEEAGKRSTHALALVDGCQILFDVAEHERCALNRGPAFVVAGARDCPLPYAPAQSIEPGVEEVGFGAK